MALPDTTQLQSRTLTPQLANTFEGGTLNADVSTANSGGISGTAFSNVVKNAGVTIRYSNVQTIRAGSTLSAAISYVANAAGYMAIALSPSSVTSRVVARCYCYLGDAGTNQNGDTVFTIRNSGGSQMAGIGVTSTGFFVAYGTASVGGTSAILPTNAWYRFNLAVTAGTTTSNGRVEYAVYSGDSPVSILSGDTGPTVNTTTLIPATARFGRTSPTGNYARTIYFDDTAASVDIASGFLAPTA